MFLKNVNLFKKCSITVRLSILYACTSIIMLLMLSLYCYWALTDILSNGNEKFLQDEVRVLRNILAKHPMNHNLLAQELEWVPEELEASEYHYYARISDQDKHVLAMTKGMLLALKNVTFPIPVTINKPPENNEEWSSDSNKKYLITSAWAKLGSTEEKRLIEIALDITAQQHIIANYRKDLLLVFSLGVICAIFLSILVAKKGMKGLNDITRFAEKISVSQLDTINISHCPQELNKLVFAFNNMLNRIEKAFRRLSQFSNELAHELRTPINNLMGEAEIILSRDRAAEEYKAVIESSVEEYNRLSRMIENMLFLARTENPHSIIKLKKINLQEEFKAIAEFYEPLILEKEISLKFRANIELQAEPLLFRRAINNLISNALNHTPDKGSINLTGKKLQNRMIEVTVSDNGTGIPKEHLPFIFDRFYRVYHDENSLSLGLGLAIVKSIMELHQGEIQVISELNHGTAIKLIFPYVL